MDNKNITYMEKYGLSVEDKKIIDENPIDFNIKCSQIQKEINEIYKPNKCFICHKKCNSFCNSHTIPRFVLKNIEEEGMVLRSVLNNDLPKYKKPFGLNKAEMFNLICNDCDKLSFSDYENPENY